MKKKILCQPIRYYVNKHSLLCACIDSPPSINTLTTPRTPTMDVTASSPLPSRRTSPHPPHSTQPPVQFSGSYNINHFHDTLTSTLPVKYQDTPGPTPGGQIPRFFCTIRPPVRLTRTKGPRFFRGPETMVHLIRYIYPIRRSEWTVFGMLSDPKTGHSIEIYRAKTNLRVIIMGNRGQA